MKTKQVIYPKCPDCKTALKRKKWSNFEAKYMNFCIECRKFIYEKSPKENHAFV